VEQPLVFLHIGSRPLIPLPDLAEQSSGTSSHFVLSKKAMTDITRRRCLTESDLCPDHCRLSILAG
jgi:hypothetical protein